MQAVSELAAPLPLKAQQLILAYLGCCGTPAGFQEDGYWRPARDVKKGLELPVWIQSYPEAIGHLLKHKKGDLQLRLPSKYFFYIVGERELLTIIAAVEGSITKKQVCWILDRQSKYIDPAEDHTLILSVRVKESESDSLFPPLRRRPLEGILLVPHNAGFSHLEDFVAGCEGLGGEVDASGYAYLEMKGKRGKQKSGLLDSESPFRAHLKTLLEKNKGYEYVDDEKRGLTIAYKRRLPPDHHSEIKNSDILKDMYESSNGFTSLSFRVSGANMRALEDRYSSYDVKPISYNMKVFGSQRALLCSTMMELDDTSCSKFQRAHFSYLKDCAIADAFPTLEESYFMPASELLEDFPEVVKPEEYGWEEEPPRQPRRFDKIEMNWSSSDTIVELAVVGRAPRLPNDEYPVFKKASAPSRYW